jgi:inhibitor of cysteine peptidase
VSVRFAAAVVAIALWLAACGRAEPPPLADRHGSRPGHHASRQARAAHAGTVHVTEADDGKTIKAAVGDTVEIALPSNPATGFEWQIVANDAGSLEPRGKPVFERQAGTEGRVGAGGTTTFRFEAAQAGTAALRLRYVQPWAPAPDAKTFTVSVEVS